MKPPTAEEIHEARIWWNALDDKTKSVASIWTILAMYAKFWASIHTVKFDSDEKVAEV